MRLFEYKFISIDEFNSTYKSIYPNARFSPDGLEVVLSCKEPLAELTKDEALKHISENWIYPEEQL